MTSSEAPTDKVEILTSSSEELSDKTITLVNSVAKTLGRRAQAIEVLTSERGLRADPERLGRISANLFEAVDTLIFLAEDIRGLQQRIARLNESREGGNEKGADRSVDEAELLAILASQDGEPISMVAILEAGFGISHSGDLTARKKHLQRTISSLTHSLEQSEATQVLVKTGKTRGTKYHLSSAYQVSTTAPQIPEPAILEPITPEPVAITSATQTTERAPTNPLEPLISDAIHRLITSDPDRPIICLADITRDAFGSRNLEQDVFHQVKQLIANDGRLEKISHFEFHIKERSLDGDWIDRQDMRERLEQFIQKMVQWDSSEDTLVNLFKSVGRGRRFLTSPERTVLIQKLKDHHQFVSIHEGSFTINATAEPSPDTQRLRGLSPSEIEKQMSQLGIKGKGQPFRRRR